MKRRFSRAAYWTVGAAIALTGAVAARIIGDQVSGPFRIPVWLTGAALIFVGLAIVSMGTRKHLDGKVGNGAGEGNRTLV